jgi:transposase-like protein
MFHVPILSDISSVLFDEEKCIEFLIEREIILVPTECECGGCISRNKRIFQCTKYTCKKSFSIYRGTFFSGNHIKPHQVMHLAYLWLTNCSTETMMQHTGHNSTTVTSYKKYFRQIVTEALESDDLIIGGEGIVVQIDESKFGKRKYNRGHRVDGAWAIVGVEMTAARKVFAEVVENRSEQTIVDVLQRHIAEGSEIWTDCWRGYSNLSRIFNVIHQTVNHSREFVNQETGVNTNTVEGTNYALKRFIPPRNRTKSLLDSHFNEFVWRRKNSENLWESFIYALKATAYIQ